jgi:hypothetical protein
VEDEAMTRVIDTDARDEEVRERPEDEERWIEDESRDEEVDDRGGWDDGEDPIAPRPRGRLLRPLPLALIAVAIAAAGFLGGVEAQKGSEGGSGSGSLPGGGNLPSFASGGPTAARAEAAGGGSESGAPTAGGAEAAATGTVTSVEGHTIYVKESDGTIVAVKAGDGSTVTRDSNVSPKKVHPGDTVVVQGSKHGSTVKASSIAATESGVETTLSFGSPTSASGGSGNEGEGSEAEASVESLFEE